MNIGLSIKKVYDTVTPALKNIEKTLSMAGRAALLKRLGAKFINMSKSTFGPGGGRYRGNSWPPLSKAYAKRIGRSEATLLKSGTLKNSLRVGPVRGNWIEVYSNHPLAATHFFGNQEKGLPARRFMPIEVQGKNKFRFTANAERELVVELSRGLTSLSFGALPRITTIPMRMPYQTGNPRTPA